MRTDRRPLHRLAILLGGLALSLLLAPPLFAAPDGDDDADGVPNSVECPNGTAPDSDGDGLADCQDPDDDGDYIPTFDELGDQDTDGDGVPNYLDEDDDGDGELTRDEAWPSVKDGDGDGLPDHLDADEEDGPRADPDHDGLTNAEEEAVGSDPTNPDTDGDTVYDGDEVNSNGTARDTDGDGKPDWNDTDDDGDGIPTVVEHDPGPYGSADPQNPSDSDNNWDDVDGDGLPNHIDTDSDGDGKSDRQEFFGDGGLPPVIGMVPIQKSISVQVNEFVGFVGFDFALPDNDADGIPNWLDTYDEDGPEGDADGDGVPNWREDKLGTNPYDPDSDGDGIEDGDEHGDSDGDGVLNRLDPDDDGDGILTKDEGYVDIDGDGKPNYLDTDSDGDGRPDAEDASLFGPCTTGGIEVPDGDNTALGYCTDRDCDGIPDNQESAQTYYVGGQVHWFSRDENGNWQVMWIEPGYTVQPALCDGPCAWQDADCDGTPNCKDADWLDGPCG